MGNTDPPKTPRFLVKGKHFLLLIYKTPAVLLINKSDKSLDNDRGKKKSM